MNRILNKKVLRDLRSDFLKYSCLFVLIVIAVGVCVGFLEGINSSMSTFDDYCEANNLEDALLQTNKELGKDQWNKIESLGVSLYENFYQDVSIDDNTILRVFNERTEVNIPSIIEGTFPSNQNELLLDRLYMEINDINVGDIIVVGSSSYTVAGKATFPDYTVSLMNTGDMLADRNAFGVCMVSEECFNERFSDAVVHNYAYRYKTSELDDEQRTNTDTEIIESIHEIYTDDMSDAEKLEAYLSMTQVIDFVNIKDNQRVAAVAPKMESNKTMAVFFVAIVIVIIGFVFAIFSKHSIQREASVIGTLLALGVPKRRITLSYLKISTLVTFLGSIIGIILGLTVFISLPVKSMTSYYSMTEMELTIDWEIIVAAAVLPLAATLVINIISLVRQMNISPLRLIRKEFKKNGSARQSKLNFGSFSFRFKLRLLFRELGCYIILLVGIFLAGWLLMFGVGMNSSFDAYKESIVSSGVSEYQYVLSDAIEIEDLKDAEKATITAMNIYYEELGQNMQVTFYGVADSSDCFAGIPLSNDGGIVISTALQKKMNLLIGDTVSFETIGTKNVLDYQISGYWDFASELAVFIAQDQLNEGLDRSTEYFNAYLSDTELDIDSSSVSSLVTTETRIQAGDVLTRTMASMIYMFIVVSVLVYIIIMYLMMNIVIGRNEVGISMLRIYGYGKRKIVSMYMSLNTILVVLFIIICMPLQVRLMDVFWPAMTRTISGYLDFVVDSSSFYIIFAVGIVAYLLASIANIRKIVRTDMSVALKNNE